MLTQSPHVPPRFPTASRGRHGPPPRAPGADGSWCPRQPRIGIHVAADPADGPRALPSLRAEGMWAERKKPAKVSDPVTELSLPELQPGWQSLRFRMPFLAWPTTVAGVSRAAACKKCVASCPARCARGVAHRRSPPVYSRALTRTRNLGSTSGLSCTGASGSGRLPRKTFGKSPLGLLFRLRQVWYNNRGTALLIFLSRDQNYFYN